MKPASCMRFSSLALGILSWLALPAPASAGQLILTNTSDKPISCKVDGVEKSVVVPPAVTLQIHANLALSDPAINSVECGNLRARMMNITPAGPDGMLVLNGQQTRVLNVLLYPYIPTLNGDFSALVTYIAYSYQAKNPQVLLNAVMDPSIEIYDFATLQELAGPNGYDVLELDMTFLGFLVTNKLIAPVSIKGDPPWPVAKATSTWNGTLYGVPSWLCTDFLYYLSNDSAKRPPQKQLRAQLFDDTRLLVSDFDGSWELPAIYLNAYVQTYGYNSIKNAFNSPIDASVIQNLVAFPAACNGDDGNPCIDGRYHNAADGTVEKVFATGNAYLAVGFSERSFFINLYQTAPGFLTAQPVEWSIPYSSTLLLYTDAFVTNASTCGSGMCNSDSQLFTSLMTSSAMKSYIAFSSDLPVGTPARRLLVATQPFWNSTRVQQDPLYQQFAVVFDPQQATIQPFPNWFTAAQKQAMSGGVCDSLKQVFPKYACTGTAATAAAASGP